MSRMKHGDKAVAITKLHNLFFGLETLRKTLTYKNHCEPSISHFIDLLTSMVHELLELLGEISTDEGMQNTPTHN